jgi:hypothetical protein
MIKKFSKYFESIPYNPNINSSNYEKLDFGKHEKAIKLFINSDDIKYCLDMVSEYMKIEKTTLYNYYNKNSVFRISIKEFIIDLYEAYLYERQGNQIFPEDWIFDHDIEDFFKKYIGHHKELKKLKEFKDLNI